jgi:uncharacterized protein YbaP (TraB family)
MIRRIALLAFAALLAAPAVRADDAPTVPVMAEIQAHPALWTVHGAKGTVYLLGSLHILPPMVNWHTPEIDAATNRADIFVFEIAMDDSVQTKAVGYIREHGLLRDGQHLRDMLSPAAQTDFDKEIALARVNPRIIDRMRPWYADITLEVADMMQRHYSPKSGLDRQIADLGVKAGKQTRALETVEQQLALLVPSDPKVEIQAFEMDLKDMEKAGDQIGPLTDAWSHGDARKLDKLMNAGLSQYPDAKKIFIDDRNKAWIAQITAMLNEDHVFFVTVGMGHLVGRHGVPALLRAKGYRVEGP